MTQRTLQITVRPFLARFTIQGLMKMNIFIDSLTNSKTINEDQKEHCDSSICIKEVLQAITELKFNKSPFPWK